MMENRVIVERALEKNRNTIDVLIYEHTIDYFMGISLLFSFFCFFKRRKDLFMISIFVYFSCSYLYINLSNLSNLPTSAISILVHVLVLDINPLPNPRDPLIRIHIFFACLRHNVLWHDYAFLSLQVLARQPVPKILLVEALLGSAGLVGLERPEAAAVGREDLVDEVDLFGDAVEAEFEFGIGDDEGCGA